MRTLGPDALATLEGEAIAPAAPPLLGAAALLMQSWVEHV
jgi:hypothetical protein